MSLPNLAKVTLSTLICFLILGHNLTVSTFSFHGFSKSLLKPHKKHLKEFSSFTDSLSALEKHFQHHNHYHWSSSSSWGPQHSSGPSQQSKVRPTQQFSGPTQQIPRPTQQFSGPTQQLSGPNQQFSGPNQWFPEPTQRFPEPTQQFLGPTQQFSGPIQQLSTLDGCKFNKGDFHSRSSGQTSCTSGGPLLVYRTDREWCLGYLGQGHRDRSLTLKLDRPYSMQHTPAHLRFKQLGAFDLNFLLPPGTIFTIKIVGRGQGLPDIEEIRLDGRVICTENGRDEDNSSSEEDKVTPKPSSAQWSRPPAASQDCGRRRVSHAQLISHGSVSRPGDWPWHVAVYHSTAGSDFKYKCGGTLISHSTVLTAAHCVLENGHQIIAERVKVQLGKHHLHVSDPHSREVLVFAIITHPGFDYETSKHDIALLKLPVHVTFSSHIAPACLPASDFYIVGQVGTIIGWGRNAAGVLPSTLHQAPMIIPSTMECLESHRDFFGYFLNDSNFCAGYRNQTTACAGDSGGGIFFKLNGAWVLRGIVSIGVRGETDLDSACHGDHFILLTDVVKHLEWIQQNMGR